MKLFLDENLSPKLVQALLAEYPASVHARDVGLLGASDQQIWDYCRQHGFAIASKDTDFREWSLVEGFPQRVEAFAGEHDSSVLILSIGAIAI